MPGLLDPTDDAADQWDAAPFGAPSYVIAQGALGSRVPRDTMPDSPRYLEDLDVAPGPRPQSEEDQALDAVFVQKQQLKNQIDMAEQQMKQLPLGSPERDKAYDQWVGMIKQFGQLNDQFKNTLPGAWSQRLVGVNQNRGPDVNTMMDAIQNRQAQPRQPLSPPAPGGVPYAPTPIAPPPATSGLTSFNDDPTAIMSHYLRTTLAQLKNGRRV